MLSAARQNSARRAPARRRASPRRPRARCWPGTARSRHAPRFVRRADQPGGEHGDDHGRPLKQVEQCVHRPPPANAAPAPVPILTKAYISGHKCADCTFMIGARRCLVGGAYRSPKERRMFRTPHTSPRRPRAGSPRPAWPSWSACGGGGGGTSGTGTLQMSLTDAPACGYDHVYVTSASSASTRAAAPPTATRAGSRSRSRRSASTCCRCRTA